LGHAVQRQYDLFQTYPLTPEFLRPLRVIPDLGVFQLADDLCQPFIFAIEVKDTP